MQAISQSAEQLAGWVIDGCERTLELVADLDDEQMSGPLLPTVNPMLWEIAHLAWFQEKFVLRQACGQPPILDFGDALYDSGAIPHDTRWRLNLPSREQTAGYMRLVAERVAQEVLRPDATDVMRHFSRYSVHHYDMHTEALTYTRQTLGLPPPKLTGVSGAVETGAGVTGAGVTGAGVTGAGVTGAGVTGAGETSAGENEAGWGEAPSGDAELAGGSFLLGALRSDPFVYDNEKWAHQVEVAPFAMARVAVTQAEFAAFTDDGGYDDPRLWSDGGAWLRATGAKHPVYWRRGPGGGWQRRHFDTWLALEPGLPVSHVCWWEADAYCRWAGRRLPAEAEWEFAATGGATPKPLYPWGVSEPRAAQAVTDWHGMGPAGVAACPAGDTPDGLRQLIGGVWEWTASDFVAYPNFERDAYHENSEQFFGQRKVLRGGAWATRGRLLRCTLRNYFTPERRDVVAGLRTCAR